MALLFDFSTEGVFGFAVTALEGAFGFELLTVLLVTPVTAGVVGTFWDKVTGANGSVPGVGGLAVGACDLATVVDALTFAVDCLTFGAALLVGVGNFAPSNGALATGFDVLVPGVDGFITAVGGFVVAGFWFIVDDLRLDVLAAGTGTFLAGGVACGVAGVPGVAFIGGSSGVFGLVVAEDLTTLVTGFSGATGLSDGTSCCTAPCIGNVTGLLMTAESLLKSTGGLALGFLFWSPDAVKLVGS